jgi:hypothetical protein
MTATANENKYGFGVEKSSPVQPRRPVALFSPSFVLVLGFLFALSLTVQLARHFVCDHPSIMFAFDGKHYLATSQALTGADHPWHPSRAICIGRSPAAGE